MSTKTGCVSNFNIDKGSHNLMDCLDQEELFFSPNLELDEIHLIHTVESQCPNQKPSYVI